MFETKNKVEFTRLTPMPAPEKRHIQKWKELLSDVNKYEVKGEIVLSKKILSILKDDIEEHLSRKVEIKIQTPEDLFKEIHNELEKELTKNKDLTNEQSNNRFRNRRFFHHQKRCM